MDCTGLHHLCTLLSWYRSSTSNRLLGERAFGARLFQTDKTLCFFEGVYLWSDFFSANRIIWVSIKWGTSFIQSQSLLQVSSCWPNITVSISNLIPANYLLLRIKHHGATPEKVWHLWFSEFPKTELQLAPPYISGYSCIIRPEPKHTASLYTYS